jgi:LmbE family N-acetylglucosaminyl deacetylase
VYPSPSVTAGVAARLAERRAAEAVSGLRRLGVGPGARTRLGVDDGGVAARETDVVDHLAARLGPRWLCVAPWRHDGHPDHDASGRAAAVAAAATGAHLVEYPVWAWHWADPESDDLPWSRCRRVGLPRAVREAKAAAIAAFVSQTTPTPAGGPPVLPPGVLRRFRRPFEVFVT